MDENRMLEDCEELRGHVVTGLREAENAARLLEGAIRPGVLHELGEGRDRVDAPERWTSGRERR